MIEGDAVGVREVEGAVRGDFEAKRAKARAADPMFYQSSRPPGATPSRPEPWSAFQADADLNQVIVSALIRRVPRVDFQTAADALLDGLDDLAVLGLAAREDRILVTHDSKTMPRYFASFIESEASPGVIVVLPL